MVGVVEVVWVLLVFFFLVITIIRIVFEIKFWLWRSVPQVFITSWIKKWTQLPVQGERDPGHPLRLFHESSCNLERNGNHKANGQWQPAPWRGPLKYRWFVSAAAQDERGSTALKCLVSPLGILGSLSCVDTCPNGQGSAVSERVDQEPHCITPGRESWPWESDTKGGCWQSPSAIWGTSVCSKSWPCPFLAVLAETSCLFYSVKENHLGTYL